jgi:hypothetical protein
MKNSGVLFVVLWPAAAFALTAEPASYQDAYVSYLDGELSVQRAAEPEPERGALHVPLSPGDRIWTHRGSRAEVRLDDGSVLRMSENTKVDFVALGAETIVRVWSGSVILELSDPVQGLRIDSPAGSAHPMDAGTYRLDVSGSDGSVLTVTRGAAELSSSTASVVVRSGETSTVETGRDPDPPRPFNTASFDDFDSWSDARSRSRAAVRTIDLGRIPNEVQSHAQELSRYGDWAVDTTYGHVWYPSVSVGWAPYRQGRWCYTRYGYTWVSYEPWGWAPYHYGRWGHGYRGWYWIPGSVWSPAWVSFAVGPYWVGWSPLGYHNRPVYGFDRHLNAHRRAYPRPTPYDRDGGWNFTTRDEFGAHAFRRLDPSLVAASTGSVSVYEDGAPLGRYFEPQETRRSPRFSDAAVRGRVDRSIVSRSAGARAPSSSSPAPTRSERSRSVFTTSGREAPPSAAIPAGPVARGRSRETIPERARSRNGAAVRAPVEIPRSEASGARPVGAPVERAPRFERAERAERGRSVVSTPRSEPSRSRVGTRSAPATPRASSRPPTSVRSGGGERRPSGASAGAGREGGGSRGASRPRQN